MELNTLAIFMYILFVIIIIVICILINCIIKRKRLYFGEFTTKIANKNSNISTNYSRFDGNISHDNCKELIKIGVKPDKIIVYRLFMLGISTAYEFNKDNIESIKIKVLGKYRCRLTIEHNQTGMYSPFRVIVYGNYNKILGVLREYNLSNERDGYGYL